MMMLKGSYRETHVVSFRRGLDALLVHLLEPGLLLPGQLLRRLRWS